MKKPYSLESPTSKRTCSLSSNQVAIANIPQYIAKEDGKNAVEDMNIPLLGIINNRVSKPTLAPSLFLIDLVIN